MAGLHELDACEIADSVRRGELRAVEVLDHFLERIGRLESTLNAFACLDPEGARTAAEEVDRKVAADEDPGPLAGVVIGVKDLENAAGLPTSFGSELYRDNLVETDSTQVARLKLAGAIVVGKTNTPEFGSISYTASKLHGVTRNPWDLRATPGGSSGGSAAAVSAGLVPMATASDGGGSIRMPAAFCGLPGLKPTFGRIPRGPGRLGTANVAAYGPLARSLRDIARYLDAASGPHPLDPLSLPAPAERYEDALMTPPKAATAVWSSTFGFGTCEPEVEAISRRAAEQIFEICAIEETGVGVDLPDVSHSWAIAEAVDCYTDLDAFWPDRSDEMTPVIALAMQLAQQLSPEQIAAANRDRHSLVSIFGQVFSKADLIVTPTSPTKAFAAEGPMPYEVDGRPINNPMVSLCFTYPVNLTGHPAISLPAGFTSDGSPVGVQIIGPRMSEDELLRIGLMFETEIGWPNLAPGYA